MAARISEESGFDGRRFEKANDDKSKHKLQKEHLLHPNSDEIDLNALLQAVLDINDRLQEQESKKHSESEKMEVNDRLSEMYSTVSSDSEFSRPPRCRPKSAKCLSSVTKPAPVDRKNMSFCNDRVDQIDRENRRLLHEISKRRIPPKSAAVRRLPIEPIRVQTASEVNRQRFHQKVDIENQQILRRLQNVKPTQSLSRNYLLKEHMTERQYASNASRCGLSSAKRKSSSLSNLSSRASSEVSFDMRDNASVTSSRASHSSRTRQKRKQFPKPEWESGW